MNQLTAFIQKTEWMSVAIFVLKIIIYIALAKILIGISNHSIDKMAKVSKRFNNNPGRTSTLVGLVKSIVKYTIYIFVAAVPILNMFHFPLESLLAMAGFGGLAIGFGAQSLVKDITTGFFILFEDQYSVGDYVRLLGMEGTVETVEMRTTKLRGIGGELYTIPNGEISTVVNFSRGNSTAFVEVSIAYESDINQAMYVMEQVGGAYQLAHDTVVEAPVMFGVTALGNSGITLKMVVKTKPTMNWQVERDLRKEIKIAFDKAGIEIPYEKLVVINHAS